MLLSNLLSDVYSPFNSQNTLFHKSAFFTLWLPVSVAFRVTDIWRSYFAQKLIHLIGNNVAFYPVNAVQNRNPHNYLNDFKVVQRLISYSQHKCYLRSKTSGGDLLVRRRWEADPIFVKMELFYSFTGRVYNKLG